MFRVAYFVTHPIQYQAPLLRLLAASEEIDLKVFFFSDLSLHAHCEKNFAHTFKWDVPLGDGYDWELLPRVGIGNSTPMRSWWPVKGIRRKLKDGNFDAVWVHGWYHIGLLQAVWAAHSLGIPVLMRGEATLFQRTNDAWRRELRKMFCRLWFGKINAYLCIGSLNREFYQSFGIPRERLFAMPYTVDNAQFQQRAREAKIRREMFRQELGLEPNRPIILYAAKFIAVKSPETLITAFQMVVSESQTLPPYLLFVGDGPLRAKLEDQAKPAGSAVRFLGFQNQSKLADFYDLCDIFVLPSTFEPWGLVVNEVMNAGKPVIVSDCVGAGPDLVKNGVNGWVFPAKDAAALAKCLTTALHSGCLEAMGRQSFEVINKWDFNADLQGLLSALKSVCAKN